MLEALKARPQLLVWPSAIAVVAAVIALGLTFVIGGGSRDSGETSMAQPDLTADQEAVAQEFLAREYGQITILNQQSYPSVDGHWIIRFTTKGTHDLVVTAIDGTTFGVGDPGDIEFVELSDGSESGMVTRPRLAQGDTITFTDYSSESEGYVKLLVHTPGPHHLKFQFGADVAYAQNSASVGLEQKISDTAGGFTATFNDSDQFGVSVAGIGDINNDGIEDIGVGAFLDDDGGTDRGAVYILFMDADGTVDDTTGFQKISDTAGGFTATLDDSDNFGTSVAGIGDINNDGIEDIAVGAYQDDDGGADRGAVYILFMDADGTVDDTTDFQKISDTAGGFTATLDNSDRFGISVAGIGDINNDGIEDIAVGADADDDGGTDRGAVYVLFMDADGTVDDTTGFQKISDTAGGFTATLDNSDFFGRSVAGIGDINNDGIEDIAAGALLDDDGGTDRGAVYVLFMDADGTVDDTTGFQKISDTTGGFTTTLDNTEGFGISVAFIGDINNDGTGDITVGAHFDDDGGTDRGAVYVLGLTVSPSGSTDGTVRADQKISDGTGGLTANAPANDDQLAFSAAGIGDLNNDGVEDIVVGAVGDDDGGTDRGAVYILFMDADGTLDDTTPFQKISDTAGTFTETLDNGDFFGWAVGGIGDIDNDGIQDIAVGTTADDDENTNAGAVYILFMNANGTVSSSQKISGTAGDFTATLDISDNFGYSVAGIGDLDKDGIEDIVVGAAFDDDGGTDRGASYILFLGVDGKVDGFQKIADGVGGLTGSTLANSDSFGFAVAAIGDLNNDGIEDIAVGAPGDDDGGSDNGALYILFMKVDGTVNSFQKISDTAGGFTATLSGDAFGRPITGIGDINKDGIEDIAVGNTGDDDGGTDRGAVFILFMKTDGTVDSFQKISDTAGGFTGTLDDSDFFGGHALDLIGDIDNDGIQDIAMGAVGDDDGGTGRGAVYVLFMKNAASGAVTTTATLSDSSSLSHAQSLAGTSSITVSDAHEITTFRPPEEEQPDDPGEAAVTLAEAEPAAASSRLSHLGKNNPKQAGQEIVAITKSNANTGADVLLTTATLNPKNAGAAFANAAVEDEEAAGQLLALAASKNDEVAGQIIAESSVVDARSTGKALAKATEVDTNATGKALAKAARNNAEATGDAIVEGGRASATAHQRASEQGQSSASTVAFGEAIAIAADSDPERVGEALATAAQTDAVATGEVIAASAESDPTATGKALAASAKKDPVSTGKAIVEGGRASATAHERASEQGRANASTTAFGEAIAVAADADPEGVGEALAAAAETDPVATGEVIATSAEVDAEATGVALSVSAKSNPKATGEALARSARRHKDRDDDDDEDDDDDDDDDDNGRNRATGRALAAAAETDAEATGDALAEASEVDDEAVGDALAKAAQHDPESTGKALARSARMHRDRDDDDDDDDDDRNGATGRALSRSAATDADATGDALAQASEEDAEAVGDALVGAAQHDSQSTGDALLVSIRKDPKSTGNALGHASSTAQEKASAQGQSSAASVAFGEALTIAAEADPDATGEALATASESNPEAIGDTIALLAGTDPELTGTLIFFSAESDPLATGTVLAIAAQEDAEAIGDTIALMAGTAPETTGTLIIISAETDPVATGTVVAISAQEDAEAIADVIVHASETAIEAASEEGADKGASLALGESLAVAADANSEALADAIARAAKLAPESTGEILTIAVQSDPTAIGEVVAISAEIDPVAIGNAIVASAEVDPEGAGELIVQAAGRASEIARQRASAQGLTRAADIAFGESLAVSAETNPDATGEALAEAAEIDSTTTGEIIAESAEINPVALGEALAASVEASPEAIGEAIAVSNDINPEATQAVIDAIADLATGEDTPGQPGEVVVTPGESLAESATENPESAAESLITEAHEDPTDAGQSLATAASLEPEAVGTALAAAASTDSNATGTILAIGAGIDPESIGSALAVAAGEDAGAIGDAFAVADNADADATGDAFAVAAAIDPDAVGDVLAEAAAIDPDAVGDVLADAAAIDPGAVGDVLADAAAIDPDALGDVLADAAAIDPDALGDVLADAAAIDPDAVGDVLADAAAIDPDAVGDVLAEAANSDPRATGDAFAVAADTDSVATGDALAEAAAEDPQATGRALASAAEMDADATGSALVEAADADAEAAGGALASAAEDNPEATGGALAEAARDDAEATGAALAFAAEKDADATGSALAEAADADAEASGAALAFVAEINSEATGQAMAIGAGIDPTAIGQALITALKRKAEAIGKAILVAARTNAGDMQAAIQAGPAQDPEASEILARVLPSISWVPQAPTKPGPDPAGGGVILEAVLTAEDEQGGEVATGRSPLERVLIKFPASRPHPEISVRVIPVLPEDVPADSQERVVSDYLEITAENFDQGDLIVAQVTLSVEKSWMKANNIHQWSIEFSRFDEDDGVWRPALANRVGEDSERILYSLVVTAFSLWSITGSEEPPPVIFQVDNLKISPPISQVGDTVLVGATVTNILDEEAEYVAVLWLNSGMSSSQTLLLGPQESAEVSFELRPEPGVYEVQIDRLNGMFEVLFAAKSENGGFS